METKRRYDCVRQGAASKRVQTPQISSNADVYDGSRRTSRAGLKRGRTNDASCSTDAPRSQNDDQTPQQVPRRRRHNGMVRGSSSTTGSDVGEESAVEEAIIDKVQSLCRQLKSRKRQRRGERRNVIETPRRRSVKKIARCEADSGN